MMEVENEKSKQLCNLNNSGLIMGLLCGTDKITWPHFLEMDRSSVELGTKKIFFCFIFIPQGQTTHTSCNGGSSAVKKVQKTTNYASVECGAKILASNPEAKVPEPCCAVFTRVHQHDTYGQMLNYFLLLNRDAVVWERYWCPCRLLCITSVEKGLRYTCVTVKRR